MGVFELSLVSEHAIITWQDGSSSDRFPVRQDGSYWVKLSEDGCEASDTILITSAICDCALFFPTAFSPNGDGKNDAFRLVYKSGCVISNYLLRIYDRWGRLVFSTTDPGRAWDGRYKGSPAATGSYMYYAQVVSGSNRRERLLKGDISLIR
jgi:gliding motility-associated-like protein